MGSQTPTVAVAAGVLTALAVGLAVVEGLFLSVDSLAVGGAVGVLAGLGVGAVVVLLVGDDLGQGARHVSVGTGLFGWIALILLFAVSSVGVANETALLVGAGVGAVVGVGAYVWLRQQDSRRVQAVTMR